MPNVEIFLQKKRLYARLTIKESHFALLRRLAFGVKNSRAFLRPLAIATPSGAPYLIIALANSTAFNRSFTG